MRYIAELERKVQTLQTEATTLSAQLTLLQVGWGSSWDHGGLGTDRQLTYTEEAMNHDLRNKTGHQVAGIQSLLGPAVE